MCGFVYSNFIPEKISLEDITPRGPDSNNTINNDLGYFYHCRLSTRQSNISQPAINNDGIFLYNGTEYSVEKDDVGFILDNLTNNITDNIEFLKILQGDFAICWVTEQYILIAKDCFSTKPLFYSVADNKFVVASTVQAITSLGFAAYKLSANTVMVFDRKTCELLIRKEIMQWNLQQGITNLHDIFDAFETSVLNQYDDNCMLNLSSGFDSGGIACCLNKHNKNYTILSYMGTENKSILSERAKLHNGKKIFITYKNFEKFEDKKSNIFWHDYLMHDSIIYDIALVSAEFANKNNIRTMLTGTGSDELFSDYGFNGRRLKRHSQFGGKFPNNLNMIFPWHLNALYPMEYDIPIVEYINGLHGIDTRHPYLDKKLFQTWLNCDINLKNNSYKNWLNAYLKQHNYPYDPNQKIGANNPAVYIN